MKLKLFAFAAIMILGAVFIFPEMSFAQSDVCDIGGGDSSYCSGRDRTGTPILDILVRVTYLLLTATVVISTIVIVISGFLFTISGSDPQKHNRARMALIYAVVAVVIAMSARTIVSYVSAIV